MFSILVNNLLSIDNDEQIYYEMNYSLHQYFNDLKIFVFNIK